MSMPLTDPALTPRQQFIWPTAAILLGGVVATNSIYEPQVPVAVGIAAWFVDLALVLILAARAATARVGVLVAGLFLAVPCLLWARPFARAFLMCCMALPLAIAVLSWLAPSAASFRARLAYVFTWLGTREVKRRPRSFDAKSLLHLLAATVILAAAIACVKIASASNLILWRWFSGGIMILAFAEMATACHNFLTALMGLTTSPLMDSPFLSTSVAEFWTRRWNPAASELVFRRFFFAPLTRRRASRDLRVRGLANRSPSPQPSPAGRGGIVRGLDANSGAGLAETALEEPEATNTYSLSQRERARVRESDSRNDMAPIFKTHSAQRVATLAMFAAFLASAIAHVLLPLMATARVDISLMCGAFFLVQPLFIVAERQMKVRQWRPAAGRAWTLAVLTITSPLFVEPALQIIEPSWGGPDTLLTPVIAVLGFVITANAFFAVGSLAASAPVVAEVKTSGAPGIAAN